MWLEFTPEMAKIALLSSKTTPTGKAMRCRCLGQAPQPTQCMLEQYMAHTGIEATSDLFLYSEH